MKIKQLDSYDCGAAALLSVGIWWGIKVPLSQVRRACGCTPEGISIEGIIDGARSLSLEAKGFKSNNTTTDGKVENLRELKNCTSPVIAHITQEDGFLHFVVIYKVENERVILMDPAYGEEVKEDIKVFAQKWNGYIVMLNPLMDFEKKDCSTNPWKWIKSYITMYKRDLYKVMAGSVVLTMLGFGNSLLMQIIIDKIIPSGNPYYLLGFSTLLMLLLPVSLYLGYARNLFLIRGGIKIDTNIVLNYLNKIFHLPASFFDGWSSGDLESRLSDSFKIRSFITESLVNLVVSALTFIMVVVLMFIFYSKLAIYAISFLPLYILLYLWANKINKVYNRELARSYALFESNVIDSLEGAESIKHYFCRNASILYSESYSKFIETRYRSSKALTVFGVLNSGVGSLLLITIIIISAFAILRGEVTIGQMVAFYTLSSFFITPMNNIIDFNSVKNQALVAAERVSDVMSIPSEKNDGIERIAEGEYKLKIENLHFKYSGRDELITNLNYEFERGKIYLIKGGNGCGKSTLAKLLLRDIAPLSGRIFLDNIDINSYNIAPWRKFAGVAEQRTHLFNATILDNITSFAPNPDLEQVVQICSRVGLLETIKKSPSGITTFVGKGGKALSGGQMQKLSIARLLYLNPTLYIFDEATSFMDNESKEIIFAELNSLRERGKIIVLISHTPESEHIADYVLQL